MLKSRFSVQIFCKLLRTSYSTPPSAKCRINTELMIQNTRSKKKGFQFTTGSTGQVYTVKGHSWKIPKHSTIVEFYILYIRIYFLFYKVIDNVRCTTLRRRLHKHFQFVPSRTKIEQELLRIIFISAKYIRKLQSRKKNHINIIKQHNSNNSNPHIIIKKNNNNKYMILNLDSNVGCTIMMKIYFYI